MDAKPIHARMVSLPKVWILAINAVQTAATRVQTIEQTGVEERTSKPWARPIKAEPAARLRKHL
jgi:hypothetical protein